MCRSGKYLSLFLFCLEHALIKMDDNVKFYVVTNSKIDFLQWSRTAANTVLLYSKFSSKKHHHGLHSHLCYRYLMFPTWGATQNSPCNSGCMLKCELHGMCTCILDMSCTYYYYNIYIYIYIYEFFTLAFSIIL